MRMATKRSTGPGALVPATAGPSFSGDGPAMREWAEELVARARSEGVELTGGDGLLTAMVRQVLQTGLEVELADHLGYEPYDPAGRGSGNSRNGSYPKTVTTEVGEVELRVPRDRNGRTLTIQVPPAVRGRANDGLEREPPTPRLIAMADGGGSSDGNCYTPTPGQRAGFWSALTRPTGGGGGTR